VRTSRYWEIIFCVLVMAAILFVGWRIGKTLWGQMGASRSEKSPVNPPLENSSSAAPRAMQTSNHPLSSPGPAQPAKAAPQKTSAKSVVILAIVGTDGKVKQARFVRGSRGLAPAALETVRQLTFNPYAPNGTAMEFETEVLVSQPGIRKRSDEKLQISIPQQAESQQTTTP
jgi:hypothetical protein